MQERCSNMKASPSYCESTNSFTGWAFSSELGTVKELISGNCLYFTTDLENHYPKTDFVLLVHRMQFRAYVGPANCSLPMTLPIMRKLVLSH